MKSDAPSSKRMGDFDASHLGGPKELRRLDPFALYALVAADEAWRQSGLSGPLEDAGSVVTTGIGGLQTVLKEIVVLQDKGPGRVSPFMVPMMMPNAATAAVSMRFGLGGPCETVTTACAAGTHAIGNAARLVASGRCSVAVAGGAEAVIVDIAEAGFRNMTALSKQDLSRPFDVDRDGFVMGEGAAVLVLEEYERAKSRGAKIYAEVAGYGTTNDAHHMTAPRPDGSQAARSMRLALEDANVSAGEIGYVNTHGSSTLLNDTTETMAIKQVLGDRAYKIPMSGTKGYYGHALGASGAIETAICALAIEREWLPPTVNLQVADKACDLNFLPGTGRKERVEHVLTNSFGFGGINAALVLRRVI